MDINDRPWLALPNEPRQAYAGFCRYLKLGVERSLDKAYSEHCGEEKKGVSGRWTKWCADWRWVERATAYDAHLEEVQRLAFEKRLSELAQRRAEEEFAFHTELLEECNSIRAMLRKAEAAPLQDVVQEKEEEDLGLAKRTTTTTKIKGLRQLSGYARLKETWINARAKTVLGIRPAPKEAEQKAAEGMPDFIVNLPTDAADSEPPASAGVQKPEPVSGVGSR